MRVQITWGLLGLVCGLLAGQSDGKPFDVDTIKDGMQMAALNAAGMAMELADNVKPNAMLKGEFGIGGQGSDSSDEERRRRRRSIADEDITGLLAREKRTPCGHRRYRQTTTTEAPDTEDIPRRRRRSTDENDIDENMDIIPGSNQLEESAHELHEKIRQVIRNTLENMTSMLEAIGKNIRKAFDKEALDSEAM